MYNDTIKVANKIISDTDLMDIFQKMDEEMKENININRRETIQNQAYEFSYQNWTMKNFEGVFKCTFNFYDDTTVTIDNYSSFIAVFNTRLSEIKTMWVRCTFQYTIQNNGNSQYISQHIYMDINEHQMSIDVNLSSKDQKMNDIYTLIKQKILSAPERYDRVVRKKASITNKITFALGMIQSTILCTLLVFVPTIFELYTMTYVLYPLGTLLLGFMIGSTIVSTKIDKLYQNIIPEKKYAGYDTRRGTIYKEDIDRYVETSEIIIGKNIDNIKNRKEILSLEKKYHRYIPIELGILLFLSVLIVICGNFFM